MGSPIEQFENARPAAASARPRFDPYTGEPLGDAAPEQAEGSNFWAEQKAAASGVSAEKKLPPGAVNPYAPVGWKAKDRVEVDMKLPSGQLVRVMRLEREDLFKNELLTYLDTFTPMMLNNSDSMSEEVRDRRIRERMETDSSAIVSMFMAIDQVVMMASVNPRVTDDPKLADYGGPQDWANPKFIATAYVNDITMDDRFAIFAEAFGRSMDDLKSLLQSQAGVAGVADIPGVQ